MIEPLTRLQQWYLSYCDDEWEHTYGISISTLDNPGWSLKINLSGTMCQGRSLNETSVGDSDVDQSWYVCWVADNEFRAAGGPLMLDTILEFFLNWSGAE